MTARLGRSRDKFCQNPLSIPCLDSGLWVRVEIQWGAHPHYRRALLGLTILFGTIAAATVRIAPGLLERVVDYSVCQMRSPSWYRRGISGRGFRVTSEANQLCIRSLVYLILPWFLMAFVAAAFHAPRWIVDGFAMSSILRSLPFQLWLTPICEARVRQAVATVEQR